LLRAPEMYHLFCVCSFLFRSCMFYTLPSQKHHNPQYLIHFWCLAGTLQMHYLFCVCVLLNALMRLTTAECL